MTAGCRRRAVLRAACWSLWPAALSGSRQARADAPIRLLVAGEPSGRLAGLAGSLASALERGWPGGGLASGTLASETLGGDDGVTGANRFEASGPSDGTALLLPGAATAAWLAGDPRVQFDVAEWLPLLCGVSGGLLAGTRPLADARPWAPLRLAVANPTGPGAACLLGLDLLGVAARPVWQRGEGDAAAATVLASGQADAAFLAGGTAAAAAVGVAPLLTLGSPASPPGGGDPAAASTPSLAAWLAKADTPDGALRAGWAAAAACVQLQYALVLSSLTDAAVVAQWRVAATRAALEPMLAAAPPVAAPACNAVLGRVATSSAALLAYRRWLSSRLGYQPG